MNVVGLYLGGTSNCVKALGTARLDSRILPKTASRAKGRCLDEGCRRFLVSHNYYIHLRSAKVPALPTPYSPSAAPATANILLVGQPKATRRAPPASENSRIPRLRLSHLRRLQPPGPTIDVAAVLGRVAGLVGHRTGAGVAGLAGRGQRNKYHVVIGKPAAAGAFLAGTG